ncbi:MAG: hypothetical protein JJE13_00325 [Thermoleophilia bacterium]|nr:hypothetical protein [Thermoleophilia bacterium]
MNKVLISLVAVIALLAAGAIGYSLGSSKDDTAPPAEEETSVPVTGTSGPTETGDTAEPETTTVTAGDPFNGLNLTAYTPGGYGTMEARQDIQLLKNIGSTSVTIVPTWYVQNTSANEIKPNAKKTPTDESLGKVISWAKQAGLKVIFKPHIDSMDQTFRGEIQPADRAAWFSSYGNFIGHYAGLAANNGVDVFAVGTELKSLSGDTDPWKKMIEDVRAKFGGQLTYAANWDEVDQVQFWDSLDVIGVDAYYPLASEGQVLTEDDLVSAWQTPISSLEATNTKWGKPIMFTEIGYPSQAGAAAHPYEVRPDDPPDQAAQAVAYRAAFAAFADKPWFQGMNWWSWRADPGKNEKLKIDYSPEGKEAEQVLADNQAG